jgi:hypothetical protein
MDTSEIYIAENDEAGPLARINTVRVPEYPNLPEELRPFCVRSHEFAFVDPWAEKEVQKRFKLGTITRDEFFEAVAAGDIVQDSLSKQYYLPLELNAMEMLRKGSLHTEQRIHRHLTPAMQKRGLPNPIPDEDNSQFIALGIFPASDIAGVLGVSKNSVLARIKRLGMGEKSGSAYTNCIGLRLEETVNFLHTSPSIRQILRVLEALLGKEPIGLDLSLVPEEVDRKETLFMEATCRLRLIPQSYFVTYANALPRTSMATYRGRKSGLKTYPAFFPNHPGEPRWHEVYRNTVTILDIIAGFSGIRFEVDLIGGTISVNKNS